MRRGRRTIAAVHGRDEAEPLCPDDGLGPVADSEFVVDAVEIPLDGADRNENSRQKKIKT